MLKILKVIHGFPPDFMAGSEVYSHTLIREFARKGHKIFVFTRIENEFLKPYQIFDERLNCGYNEIFVRRINKPKDYRYMDKFIDKRIDMAFENYLKEVEPDIVHFGHLSHLSVNLVSITKRLGKKVVFTLHDFWLFCVKGQLINQNGEICKNPSIKNCQKCSLYRPTQREVERAFALLEKARNEVDIFISPSHTLRKFFIKQGIAESKIIYQKYGFDTKAISYKRRVFEKNSTLKFGFLGRIIPTKGISVLLETFKALPSEKLQIYGHISDSQKRFLTIPNVEFMGAYDNPNINEILDSIDILLVPSIWLENSPLVMQEAFLAGVIVIASNLGGMAELIKENEGFLFQANNTKDLTNLIQKIKQDCRILNTIKDNRNKVDSIEKDATNLLQIYQQLLNTAKLKRITIDTNPDTCNFKCKMCDTHSIYNKHFIKSRPDMPLNVLRQALEQAKICDVSEIIPTTMGEPTLYRHFDEIVEFCLHNHIKLNLTTNGSQLFSKKYDENYIKHKLLPALSDIKISFNSLDSAINEDIMRNSNTKQILAKIEKLCGMRNKFSPKVSITLQMTFMKSNLDSIKDIIEYAIKHKINRIKGHQLWITHKELENEALYKDKHLIKLWNELVLSFERYSDNIRLENFTPIQDSAKAKGECPFLGQELWINYRGDISVCCAPDKQRASLGDFGNITSISLDKVILSAKYRNLVKHYPKMEICKKCLMRR